jgi:SSS family solute:Na+ symporter
MATLFPDWPEVVRDLNVGIVAMVVNVAVLTVVTLATRARERAAIGAVPAADR